mgnify:CR=1 FL=1
MSKSDNSGLEQYLSYLIEHWAIAASIGYLYLTIIGMVQAGVLFSKYEINIFEFAEINDFLLAAFREPVALLTGLGLLLYLGFAFTILYRRKGRNITSSKLFASKAMLANIFLSGLFMPIAIQILFADYFSDSYNRKVSIELRRGTLPDIADISTTKFKLIGTSENFVFLHSKDNDRSYIVPTSNIVGLAIEP